VDYNFFLVLAMFDAHLLGIDGRRAEKLALDVESDLRDAFEAHPSFDADLSDHGSGAVARTRPGFNWYGVYLALKVEHYPPPAPTADDSDPRPPPAAGDRDEAS